MSSNPYSALVAPTATDPVPDILENALSGSYLSPTYWLTAPVNAALGFINAPNPIDWIADFVAGDWMSVQEAGLAVAHLSKFNGLLSGELSSAMEVATKTWQGDAANSASQYFDGLAQAIESQKSAINSLGKQIEQTAIGMYEASQAIKGGLAIATDSMIEFLITLAAAKASTALAATGVGAAVTASAWAAAVAMGYRVYSKIDKVLDLLNYAFQGAQATVGVIAGYMATVKDVKLPNLPDAAYDHGEV